MGVREGGGVRGKENFEARGGDLSGSMAEMPMKIMNPKRSSGVNAAIDLSESETYIMEEDDSVIFWKYLRAPSPWSNPLSDGDRKCSIFEQRSGKILFV
ncbi:hypothetical protein QYF36_017085 [Acer negundo]|nr:hypothetical protein QYF36_017085 [Acer negundo]